VIGAVVVDTTKNNILATVNVTLYNSLKALYEDLLALKKDVFADDERIVIVYNSSNQKKLVGELLSAIDIPDFFVIFETSDNVDGIDFSFSDSFCIYPWINLRVSTTGDLSPCCTNNTIISNLSKTSIQKAYQSDTMKGLRQAFLAGDYPSECSKCWKEEAVGKPSMRQRAKHKFKDIYYRLNYQSEDINNLQLFDLNLGNACNLSCRICNHASSSSIANLDHKHSRLSEQQYIKLKQSVNWSETDEFWDQLLTTAQNLKYLDLYGGEPLMSKNHFNFLRKLIDLGVAKNIQIDYNSNGTMYSDRFFDLWEHFKSVKISFSIDDIEDRFEYQRNGSNWSQVNNNIKKYRSKISDRFTIDIFPTINIQNVYYLPELLQWAQTVDLPISFSILHDPSYMSINNVPDRARSAIISKLQPFVYFDVISSVISVLERPNNCDGQGFIKYMKTLDSERQQNFQYSHKEIAQLIGYGK